MIPVAEILVLANTILVLLGPVILRLITTARTGGDLVESLALETVAEILSEHGRLEVAMAATQLAKIKADGHADHLTATEMGVVELALSMADLVGAAR